jgi:long-chain acyl-CoA synthetase
MDLTRINSIGEALDDATLTFKSNVAVIEANRKRENVRFTYTELRRQAQRLGALLQEKAGFEPGERCAILMSNQSKWLISATGALWAGATLVPLDYKLTASEQMALLEHAKPKVLITEYPTWRLLAELAESPLEKTLVLVTEAPKDADLGSALAWETVPDATLKMMSRSRDDVACIVYSSGTGGTPKGCMLTHGNYLEQAQVLGRLFPMKESDRYFSILPTNHAIDFMCGFIIPWLFGGAVVHQRTLRPEFLVSTMKRYSITHMALVPMLLKAFETRIREKLDALPSWQRTLVDGLVSVNQMATRREPRHQLSSKLLKPIHDQFGGRLKLIFCGGAFVDRKSAEFFYKLGLPVVIGYGLTEAGTVLTLNDLKPFRADTVGRAVPGLELEIRDKNAAGVGEIWVKGPTVMAGYLDEVELTAETIVDGWLKTGDLGKLDPSGHLKLMGRAKNMIVTEGGKNVYPEDIEAAFEDLDEVEEHCVFAANYIWPTGKMTGEQLVLALKLKNGGIGEATLSEIKSRNRRLSDFKRLSGYVIWEQEFPRTASMKIKRNQLADELAKLDRNDAVRSL